MKDVLDNQIPKLDNNQDAITLSIGESFPAALRYKTEGLHLREPSCYVATLTLLMKSSIQVVMTSA